MKANRRVRRGNKPSNLIIAPMIDVVFQLVLFLLVSTNFSIKPALNLTLPKSESARGSEAFELVLKVPLEGDLVLNGTEIPLQMLSQALDVFNSEFPVTVEADENVPNWKIVRIFDALSKKGFSEVNLRSREIAVSAEKSGRGAPESEKTGQDD